MKKKRTALVSSILALLLCVSMLMGTTLAWFTDGISSQYNQILAGSLDVELEQYVDGKWVAVNESTNVFDEDALWEPGYTQVVYLRVRNAGNLALEYQLGVNIVSETGSVNVKGEQFVLSDYIEYGAIQGVQTPYASREAARAAVTDSSILSNGYTQQETLLPGAEPHYVALVVFMPEEVGNDANYATGVPAPQINLGIQLTATQEINESDTFDNTYDSNAAADFFPGFQGGAAGVVVTPDDQGLTTAEVTMDGGDVAAVIPVGVQVDDGIGSLALTVTLKENSEANIQLGESEEMRPLDVHIEGVAQGNTVPMLITLKQYLTTGINTGALKLYHVENGTPVAMTQVATPVNHNEFSYDPLTGDVTLALASFSEVAVVADSDNTWNGTVATAFADGDGTEADPYLITNADQLAYFRNQVDGGETFAGKFVKLTNNITLSNVNFDPIGWGYENSTWNSDGVAGKVFKGTFDGGNNIIFDLYQSGWDLESATRTDYTYTNCGFGLFAAAADATFKNLTISGANIVTECVEMGILVGLSQGSCTYEKINIHNSKIANYQRPTGGLIGEVSGSGTTTITNVVIGSDVVVGSLWGDFDAPCGGVIGARWDDVAANPQIEMKNVEVSCRLDVYNDVTAAYQWHAYRRAGMLIGNTDTPEANGKTAQTATADFLTCHKNEKGDASVVVYLGSWANYHYCQFTNEENPGRNYPWVRVEAGEKNSAYSNPRYGHPTDVNGNIVDGESEHKHQEGDICNMPISFAQLYGGGQGVYGRPVHDNVKVIGYRYSIIYVNNDEVLSTQYVTDDMVKETNPFIPNDAIAEDAAMEWIKKQGEQGEYENAKFGGWVNAGSTLVKIPADNTENVTVYPSFETPYTARFVDAQGNVLAWCFFNEKDVSEISATADKARELLPKQNHIEFEKWQVIDSNDDIRDYAVDDFKNYKDDVTVYPVFKYEGDVQLIPIDDNQDGKTDYYQVGGYGTRGKVTLVEIPSVVNGIPVTEINADAFSSYDDLHSVRIPGTIEAINSQSFTADNPNQWGTQRDTVTIYYEGDPDYWKAEMEKYEANHNSNGLFKTNWDNNMGDGSRVFFLVDGKVDNTKYWELNSSFKWVLHNHAYSYEAAKTCAHGEDSHYEYGGGFLGWGASLQEDEFTNYAGTCDCSSCNGAKRPDADYWN